MTTTPEQKHYRLAIRRPVTVVMVFVTLLVFGWRSYRELPINLMPDISYPTLTVRTEFEGGAPADVEKLVTRPLEERLSIVSGVVEVSSVSSAGLSEIILEFTWDTDMNVAMQDVRENLDLFQPPTGVTQNPVILRYDPTLDPVMRIAIVGRDLEEYNDDRARARQLTADLTEIRNAAEEQIKGDLEAEIGVAQVVVKGGREEEIQVLVDSERLKALGITPENVATILNEQNINLSGGRLREGRAEYLVRTLNEFQDIEEISAVVLGVESGQQMRLDDVARVQLAEKERETIVRVNGREAVELEFFKEGDANIVDVCSRLKDFFGIEREKGFSERAIAYLGSRVPWGATERAKREQERRERLQEQLHRRLPDYASVELITDQSRFIEASIREVQQTAVIGGILALCVLYLFLREIRSTLIIGVAIPISVVATFVPMYMQNISLNIMSLGGLALGVGMLVDNSIVVLESIFRCKEEGDGTKDAAERGTHEVASAVTASTLTTIAVFFPIIFVVGIAGQLFRDLALTVTFSLLASLLVALFLIPMIASREGGYLTREGTVIWVLRAFREARARGASSRGAVASLPKAGYQYSLEWLRDTWKNSVGAMLRAAGKQQPAAGDAADAPSRSARVVALVSIPLLIVLFVLQSVLKLAGAILATLLFAVTLVVLALLWIIGRVFKIVFYLPIQLFDHAFGAIRSAYRIVLRQALQFSPLILIAVVVLAVHAGYRAQFLGRELIPPMKQGEFGIRIDAPPGTRLESTETRAMQVADIVMEDQRVASVTLQAGTEEATSGANEGENVAILTVKLRNPDQTVQYQDEIMEDIRRRVTARAVGSQVAFTLPSLFSFKTAMELQIYGEDDRYLREMGTQAIAVLRDIPGLKDLDMSLKSGYPEVHITLDRDLLAAKGLSPYAVAQALRTEVQGEVATRFSRAGEKIDIRVRSDQERLASLSDLRDVSVTEGHPPTPLSDVAEIRIEDGPSEIRRIDQHKVVLVTANVEGRDLGSVSSDIEERMAPLSENWPDEYRWTIGGQQRELESSYGSLIFALALATFLVYVVMACQFESLWHPALIMFSVPLAFVGVVYVLDWQQLNLSIVVFIGGIVLAGIVVNAAIVLVDYINQLRARGLAKIDAIVEAATIRFRPILMTTMTTVLGLVPMALSIGEGAEIRQPMAITVMAGLLSSTVLTLIIIPVIYNLFGGREKSA